MNSRTLILTVNAGSSSLRLNLFVKTDDGLTPLVETHHQSVAVANSSLLTDFVAAVNISEIKLIVHRVVHGC